MTDVVEVVRSATNVPRNAWSDTAEGRATRERAFSTDPNTVPRNRFPKWPALIAAVLVVALVATVAHLLRGRDSTVTPPSGDPTVAPIAGDPTLEQLTNGTWRELPGGPIETLRGATALWTGQVLLVWSSFDDRGAAFDPATSTWTEIPPSGVTQGQQPVWAGDRLIVWEGYSPDSADGPNPPGAAYDPRSQAWSAIPTAPIRRAPTQVPLPVVSTGAEVVVAGGVSVCDDASDCSSLPRAVAAYSPATDTWRRLPDLALPDLVYANGLAWDGARVVALAGDGSSWALDPAADSWTQLIRLPNRLASTSAIATPGGLVWVGSQIQVPAPAVTPGIGSSWGAYRLPFTSDVWLDIAAPFDAKWPGPVTAVGVGRLVAVLGSGASPSVVLDTTTGTWHPMPAPSRAVGSPLSTGAVWTGHEILGLQSLGEGKGYQLAVYTPGRR